MIRAKVIAKTTIDNEPAAIGSIVVVDENTFRNLQLKGRLELAPEETAASEKKSKPKPE